MIFRANAVVGDTFNVLNGRTGNLIFNQQGEPMRGRLLLEVLTQNLVKQITMCQSDFILCKSWIITQFGQADSFAEIGPVLSAAKTYHNILIGRGIRLEGCHGGVT